MVQITTRGGGGPKIAKLPWGPLRTSVPKPPSPFTIPPWRCFHSANLFARTCPGRHFSRCSIGSARNLSPCFTRVIYGGTALSRKPMVTISANGEHSPLRIESADHLRIAPPEQRGSILDTWEAAIRQLQLHEPHHAPRAWIGHFSYDLARILEPIPSLAKNDHPFPLLHWQLFEEYFLFDHATQLWTAAVTTHGGFAHDATRLHAMEELLRSTRAAAAPATTAPQPTLLESFPRESFLRSVERIKDYIAAGDIFQANFAQRWKFHIPAHPIDLFQTLMRTSPSAYAALLIDFARMGRAALRFRPRQNYCCNAGGCNCSRVRSKGPALAILPIPCTTNNCAPSSSIR